MSTVYKWGKGRGLCKTNPADLRAANVKPLKIGEHKAWSPDAPAKFRAEGQPHL